MNSKITIKFTKSADGYPALLVGVAWAANPLLYYIGIFADKIGIGSGFFIMLLFLFLGIKSINYLKRIITISDIIILVSFVSVFLSTYYLFPTNKEYLDRYKDYFYLAVPYYIIGRVYSDCDMRDCLTWFSYISIAAMAVFFLFWRQQTGSLEEVEENMVSSYMILPHVLMILLTAFKQHSIASIIFSLLGLFLILSFGTRGPLICIFIYIALILIITPPFKHKAISYTITVSVITVILVMFDKILEFLQGIVSSIGMSTRIFDYYTMGMISDDSGRRDIRVAVLNALNDHLFTGLGLGGDARVVGGYSHNVIIEILASFGVIFGSVILLLLLILFYRSFLNCRKRGQKEMWVLFVVCGFVGLMFSGTFITSAFFYLVIGYCITLLENKRKLLTHQI